MGVEISSRTLVKKVRKSITLAGAGDYNIFKVTGTVQVNLIYGIITTAIAAATTDANLNLFPTGGAAIPITLGGGGGRDISSYTVGSYLSRIASATTMFAGNDASTGIALHTNGNIYSMFVCGQKTGIETHIRLSVAGAGGSGVILWVCDWEPLSDDGLLEPA